MPKKTLLLILILAIITAVLVGITLYARKNTSENTETTAVPSEEVVPATAVISFNPSTIVASGSAVYQAQILINTGGSDINGVQLGLQFDPGILTNVRMIPPASSPLIPNIQAVAPLINEVDTTAGIVTYAVGINPGTNPLNGNGSIGTFEFSVAPGTPLQNTRVTFSGETLVASPTQKKSILKQVIPLNINISGTSIVLPNQATQSGTLFQ